MTVLDQRTGVTTSWHHPDRLRPNALPARTAIAKAMAAAPWPNRDLATPPGGSSAAPVRGSHGLPLLGHSVELLLDGIAIARHNYDRYGPIHWTNAFGVTTVMALGPDATQVVLGNRDKAYSQTGWEYFIGPFFYRGLMLLDFDEHLLHRRIMQEAFTRERLTAYLSRVDGFVRRDLSGWPAAGDFFAYPTLKRLSLDIATEIFMGSGVGADREAVPRAFTDAVRAGTAVVRRPLPGNRWQRGLAGRRVLEEFFRSRLADKRAQDSDDLFAALCHVRSETGEAFSDDDVVNHMIFAMMAAHDTTTITTTATMAALAAHPEWQERAREESLHVGEQLTPEGVDRLAVLDLVIREALRLVAPVPSMARMAVRDTELLGHFVPAGTLVSTSPWFNHHMPEWWNEPEQFDPERFAEPRREDKRHRYSWVPFGGGAHKCIGMAFGLQEVKTLLHHLLRRYRWSTPRGYAVPWDLVALPIPGDGLPLTVAPI